MLFRGASSFRGLNPNQWNEKLNSTAFTFRSSPSGHTWPGKGKEQILTPCSLFAATVWSNRWHFLCESLKNRLFLTSFPLKERRVYRFYLIKFRNQWQICMKLIMNIMLLHAVPSSLILSKCYTLIIKAWRPGTFQISTEINQRSGISDLRI
jgi:hypothetical protein